MIMKEAEQNYMSFKVAECNVTVFVFGLKILIIYFCSLMLGHFSLEEA